MSDKNLFQKTLARQNTERPPIWLMRQAGRYHGHYQALRGRYSFMDLCKIPKIATEVTMGPIRDFDFDAAILFSDLLFPLEVMGMGLRYEPAPKLDWHLKSKQDLERLQGGASLVAGLNYQAQAMEMIRKELPPQKGLIGFVGGPFTLFSYAVEGSHKGGLEDAKRGLTDGRFEGFLERLLDLLAHNMALQAKAGADTIAVMDTCAGELDPLVYRERVVPSLKILFSKFRELCPETPITYYSKKTGPAHWDCLLDLPIACKGIDWNHDLAETLSKYGKKWVIQGNIDPHWLFLESKDLEAKLRQVWGKVKELPAQDRANWICGLGHGVMPLTPEANVRLFVKLSREIFA